MKKSPLIHYNERPTSLIDTIIIHSLHAPDAADPFHVDICIDLLDHHHVAAHYVIDRAGQTVQCVDDHLRAWHAGDSRMPFADDTRENVNDFSIGIELIGSETSGFTQAQYMALETVISKIASKYPIRAIVGHEHIAPGRKTDPGPLFDWGKLAQMNKKQYRYPVPV